MKSGIISCASMDALCMTPARQFAVYVWDQRLLSYVTSLLLQTLLSKRCRSLTRSTCGHSFLLTAIRVVGMAPLRRFQTTSKCVLHSLQASSGLPLICVYTLQLDCLDPRRLRWSVSSRSHINLQWRQAEAEQSTKRTALQVKDPVLSCTHSPAHTRTCCCRCLHGSSERRLTILTCWVDRM